MITRKARNANRTLRNLSMIMLLVIAIFTPGPLVGQNLNGAFKDAIDNAQRRMVKVYGATAGRVSGYSSGVIVTDDGLIVTMQGVYLDGRNIRIVMHDGSEHQAVVLRRHRGLQLALLKIDVATPDYFELPNKPVGKKGDWVVTLSNAFKVADGVEPMSVNLGIISLRTGIDAALTPRDVAYSGELVLIDAITSNPGAGGGAVVTVDGKLVGSIGRVINSTETNTRLNYAVPGELLRQFVAGTLAEPDPAVTRKSKVPADLGFRLFTLGGRGQPAYIDQVARNSPAGQAGLRADDLVISLNGNKIGTVREFQSVMESISPGQEVIIIVKRKRDLIRVALLAVEKKRR